MKELITLKRTGPFLFLFLLLVLLMPLSLSPAEQASPERILNMFLGSSRYSAGQKTQDGDYSTYGTVNAGKTLELECTSPVRFLQVRHYERAVSYTVEARMENVWVNCGSGGRYLAEAFFLPKNVTRIRLHNTSRSRLFLSEIQVWGEGDQPRSLQVWREGETCDLMLISCHPDDEMLWFAGLLPTYAGERQMEVQTVTVVPSTPVRRLELLDALWTCGVTRYPALLGFPDVSSSTLARQYRNWNRNQLERSILRQIRRYKPEVVVTHDLKGEYGHGGHMAVADATVRAVENASLDKKDPESAGEYGVWDVKKLYLHLYGDAPVRMDWHQPLVRFGGKDSMEVAREAFACHVSQTRRGWAMEEGGKCDNSLFGLYRTLVGPDVEKKDLMENTPLWRVSSSVNPMGEDSWDEVVMEDEEEIASLTEEEAP